MQMNVHHKTILQLAFGKCCGFKHLGGHPHMACLKAVIIAAGMKLAAESLPLSHRQPDEDFTE